MRGIRTDGIRTIADLKLRCFVDELTGCWRYSYGSPQAVWIPALGKRSTLGTLICLLKTWKTPDEGIVWHRKASCETKGCANPDHRQAGNRSTQMKAAQVSHSPVSRAKIAAAKRAISILSDEEVEEIRCAEGFLKEIAAAHGISIAHASRIRRNEVRVNLAGRGASVFNLGGVA